jgi:hypothetical protein
VKLRKLFRRRRREREVVRRPGDYTDALTTARANQASPYGGHGGAPPPGWVKGYDDGRPRT